MNRFSIRTILACAILVSCGGSRGDPASPDQELQGPYFGQSPPGSVPLPFAPEIFTLELHSSPVFSPDGREVFWSEMDGGGIRWMRMVNGVWSGPSDPPFALPYSGEPVFGPRGDTLYFLSAHRSEESRGNWDEDVWRTARTGSAWSQAERLPPPVNDHPMHWGVSLAANRNLYFGQTEGAGGIYFSEFRDGEYLAPVPLGARVNSQHMETTPCVAPDESFLVFSRVVERGLGPIDLYVSFRNPDGSWGDAVPLSAVNTGEREISPRLSPDGEYLFFLRTVNGELMPFWVRATVITDLKPT